MGRWNSAVFVAATLLITGCDDGATTEIGDADDRSAPIGTDGGAVAKTGTAASASTGGSLGVLPIASYAGAGSPVIWDLVLPGSEVIDAAADKELVLPSALSDQAIVEHLSDWLGGTTLVTSAVTGAGIWPITVYGEEVGYFIIGPEATSLLVDVDGDNSVDVWDMLLATSPTTGAAHLIVTGDVGAAFLEALPAGGVESWCALVPRGTTTLPQVTPIELCNLEPATLQAGARPLVHAIGEWASLVADSSASDASDVPQLGSTQQAGVLDPIIDLAKTRLSKNPAWSSAFRLGGALVLIKDILEFGNETHSSPCELLGSGACERRNPFGDIQVEPGPETTSPDPFVVEPDDWAPQPSGYDRYPDDWLPPNDDQGPSGTGDEPEDDAVVAATYCPFEVPPGLVLNDSSGWLPPETSACNWSYSAEVPVGSIGPDGIGAYGGVTADDGTFELGTDLSQSEWLDYLLGFQESMWQLAVENGDQSGRDCARQDLTEVREVVGGIMLIPYFTQQCVDSTYAEQGEYSGYCSVWFWLDEVEDPGRAFSLADVAIVLDDDLVATGLYAPVVGISIHDNRNNILFADSRQEVETFITKVCDDTAPAIAEIVARVAG